MSKTISPLRQRMIDDMTFRNMLPSYGQKCAVCSIRHPQLLIAAHICGKSVQRSDDWRNGLPLCASHHEAFDNHLFAIEPTTGRIQTRRDIVAMDIGLNEVVIKTLKNCPHPDALRWRWSATIKIWGTSHQGGSS